MYFPPAVAAQEAMSPGALQKNLLPPLTQIETSKYVFSRFKNWQFAVYESAKATMAVEGAALKITVTQTDGTGWHTQVRCKMNAVNGTAYELRFRAKADAPRPIEVFSEVHDQKANTYKNIGLAKKFSLTPEWQTFTTQFTAHSSVDGQSALPEFFLSEKIGTVWLSDVSLVEKPASAPAEKIASAPAQVPAVSNAGVGVGPKPRAGEIKLTGSVMMIKAADKSLLIAVSTVTQSDGATTTLPTPRPKTILINPQTLIVTADLAQKTLADIKEGDTLTVIGKDAGTGKTMTARTVIAP
jgi:hypothetical protein